ARLTGPWSRSSRSSSAWCAFSGRTDTRRTRTDLRRTGEPGPVVPAASSGTVALLRPGEEEVSRVFLELFPESGQSGGSVVRGLPGGDGEGGDRRTAGAGHVQLRDDGEGGDPALLLAQVGA